jgi:adenine deaminase
MQINEVIRAALAEREVDLLIKNAQVVDVLSADIFETDVAIYGGYIVGFGNYKAKTILDIKGRYLAPSFIDGHVHIESSMITLPEYARVVVPHGTSAVIIDPHEIANVLGIEGINYMLRSSEELPLSVYLMLPSCVPATNLETSGARLSSGDLALLIDHPRVLGLAEMMNFPGVLSRDQEVLNKIIIARHKLVDGHAPGLSGQQLNAYISAGIYSDHECVSAEEALEKSRKGMYIMVREGSTAKNLAELLKVVTPQNSRRFFFVTDDKQPEDLLEEGHIDYLLKLAVEHHLDPIVAIQMATINAVEYFGLKGTGAVAPGYEANLVVLEDLKKFRVNLVFKDGEIVAEAGEVNPFEVKWPSPVVRGTVNIDMASLRDIGIKAKSEQVKVIEVIPDQIVTKKVIEKALVKDGLVVSDTQRDILKIAVVERHLASGNIGLALVKGFGLKEGAIASSVAHDSHNIVAVGVKDRDITRAVEAIKEMSGGQVVVRNNEVLANVPLPVAGLMSESPAQDVAGQVRQLNEAAQKIGCKLTNPFMTLAFLALPVIPELKITDKGLVDVTRFEVISLFGKD